MTDIDTKALALRVAFEIDADMDYREQNHQDPNQTFTRLYSGAIDIAEARALASFLREAVGDGWQDIASAPKDGTRILAIENYQREGEDGKLYPEDAAVVRWAVSRHDGYGGWAGYGLFLASFEPTHWRPLPPPPSEAATLSQETHHEDK